MGEGMSFSSELKNELCKIENKKDCCQRAEAYGIWLFSKTFSLLDKPTVTQNAAVLRKMSQLAAMTAGITSEITFDISRRKKHSYSLSVQSEFERKVLLEYFGHTGEEKSLRIDMRNIQEDCCIAAFLRGAFLVCGVATDPNKDYHLEFVTQYKNVTKDLLELLKAEETFGWTPAVMSRLGTNLLYFKDSAQIEDLLAYIGARSAAMQMMQIKMYREAKNNINRRTNFETANMDKTYSASAKQTAAIAIISDVMGLDKLPDELREVAVLRLENPEMTLRELAEKLRISRSGANHRMRKITELGDKLADKAGVGKLG